MKRFTKILFLGTVLALALAMVVPVTAQGPGEGGVVITDNIGGDPSTFIPFIGSDTVSSSVYAWMYPSIIAIDPFTLDNAPNVAQGMASGWEYDETGTVMTLYLREDITWSDGTPITARDYLWAVEAVRSGQTSSPRTSAFTSLADGTPESGSVDSIELIDDYTLRINLGDPVRDEEGNVTGLTPNCIAINDINDVTPVPAHLYEEAFGDDYASIDADPFFVPTATFGPFTDPFFEAGVQVSLIAEPSYPDTQLGYVSPSEWVLLNVPDTTVAYERFLAGEITYTGISADRQNAFRELAADGSYQFFEYADNGYTYMGYNLADPNNPQPGLDENGDIVDQGLHPIFSDILVRQAFAYAIDVPAMIGSRPDGDEPATGILEGNGFPIYTHNSNVSWVDDGLEPYAFDPERALELLAEAGWVDNDGDGLLECNDCLYAREVDPEFNGSPLEFELVTNAGNVIRERTGQTIREQLAEIGVTVNFSAIDFGALVDLLLSQTHDAIIIGWSLGLPFDPDGSWAFSAESDNPGSGFGFTSYNNPELNELWQTATTLPGCDRGERLGLYQEAMRILYEEQPYMWLFSGNVMAAAQGTVENYDPLPLFATWNIDAWNVISDQ